MALFVEIQVTAETAGDPKVVKQLLEVCPVNIFGQDTEGRLEMIEENVDECTLCELCLDGAPPGAIKVLKLYDEGRALERGA